MRLLLILLLWTILLVLCWPLAILVMVLWPILWLISLPFRILGIAVHALRVLAQILFFLPARLLSRF